MSDTLDYKIVPSKINPKIGLVVSLNPVTPSPYKSFYKDAASRRKDHIANHREGFKTRISKLTESTYLMRCTHLFHYLRCDLTLIIDEDDGIRSVICDFPAIDGEVLNVFVNDEEFLYESFITHFHLNIMHQLLLFCENHSIDDLVLRVDKYYYRELGSYERIMTFPPGSLDHPNYVTLSIDPDKMSAKDWEKSMKKSIEELQKELWCEQKTNADVQEYMKLDPFHDLFC